MNKSEFGQSLQARQLRRCDGCGQGLAHGGLPLFWRVHVERLGIDARAVQQRAGLTQYFGGGMGGAALADVMGTGEPIAAPFSQHILYLCEPCAIEKTWPIAAWSEIKNTAEGAL